MRPGKGIALGLAVLALIAWLLLRGGADETAAAPTRHEQEPPSAELPVPAVPVEATRSVEPAALAAPPTPAPETPVAASGPPRSHVFGRVTNLRDEPLAGLSIHAGSVGEDWADPAVYPELAQDQGFFETTTDADGRFSFDLPVPSSSWTTVRMLRGELYYFRFDRSFGHAGGRRQEPLHAGDNDLGTIKLADAGAFEGLVRDEGGAPISAVVSVEDCYPNGLSVNSYSDDSGRFLVGGVPAGTYTVTASRDGYVTAERTGLTIELGRTTSGFDFVLKGAASIAGRVVDENGLALAGIGVDAWPVMSGQGSFGRTGEDGRFELPLPQSGSYRIEIEQEGFETLRNGPVLAPGTRDATVVIRRLPSQRLRVVDAVSGQPIERCGAAESHGELTIATHAGGLIELKAKPDERLRVEAEGHVPVQVSLADAFVADDGVRVVALAPELAATGRVVRDGAAVPHAVVRVRAAIIPSSPEALTNDDPFDDGESDVPWPAGHERALSADADGRFRAGLLTAGHWELELEARGAAPRTLGFLVENADVALGDIALTGGGSIAGHVVLPAGTSAAGLVVGLDCGSRPEVGEDLAVVLDAGGEFGFDALAPGPHKVVVGASQGLVRTGPGWPVTVEEGQTTTLTLDLAELAPHRITVTVRLNGEPAAGLTVMRMSSGGPSSGGMHTQRLGVTDGEGRVLAETDGGAAQLAVLGGGGTTLASLDVVLRPGDSSQEVLSATAGRLHVRVADALLRPFTLQTLHVNRTGEDRRGGFLTDSIVHLSDDLYDVGPVLPGRYDVRSIGVSGVLKAEAEITAGAVSEVRLTADNAGD